MLKLSTEGRYGVRAMYEIAKHYPNTVIIKGISIKQGISIPYLEQILNKLKHKTITLKDIIELNHREVEMKA
ncbi:Rrf2 family transcriptional regulator [Thermodesulfovibrio sp.]|uniref:Rrf2 family transcriptional regulator n=1 Tax=Thermodesulfovibrio sp. TaxID=2067987 RepID=UPI003C7DD8C2